MSQEKIVIYQLNNTNMQLEFRVEEETVWLTQAQLVELFDSSKQKI